MTAEEAEQQQQETVQVTETPAETTPEADDDGKNEESGEPMEEEVDPEQAAREAAEREAAEREAAARAAEEQAERERLAAEALKKAEELAGDSLHPLDCEWTFWFDTATKPSFNKGGSWQSGVSNIATVHSIETFWGLYNHIVMPSDSVVASTYMLFRTGIKPLWEDPAFKQEGGKWTLLIPKGQPKERLTSHFENLSMLAVGESFTDGDLVGGITCQPRKKVGDRLSVWVTDKTDEDRVKRIGTELKEGLGFGDEVTLSFTPFTVDGKALYTL